MDAERDLGDARLLFRGTTAEAWGLLAIGVWSVTVVVGLLIGRGDPVPAALGVGALLAVEMLSYRWVVRRAGWGAAAWAAEDALVLRLRRDRWLRIPWSEIRGGTWVHTGRFNGPALTTAGDRDERPNPTWYATPCRPTLREGWQAGARVLQQEFERRGIPWRTFFDDRRLAERWDSARWDW